MFDGTKNTAYETSEQKTKNRNLFRIGKIEAVRNKVEEPPQDEEQHNWTNEDRQGQFRGQLVRVKIGEGSTEERHQTYWTPIATNSAGSSGISYDYHEVGEQVLVLCEAGNPMTSWVIKSGYQDGYRPPVSWDQPTKDGRAWDSRIKQYECSDGSYFEFRDMGCPVVPEDGRLLFAGLKAANQLFEYYTHPEKRKLHIHIKEMHLELDGNYLLQITESGAVEIQQDAELSAKKLVITVSDDIEVQGANITLNADTAINLNAPTVNMSSTSGSKISVGANTEINSPANNIMTAGGANKLSDGAGAHGHS